MNRKFLAALTLGCIGVMACAQPKELKFHEDGSFRIVQFTDTHLDPSTPERHVQAEKTFPRISRIVRTQKPDLIVFTGDVVTGPPAEKMWKRLTDSLDVYGVPYVVVFGNHDSEQNLTRPQLADCVLASKYSLNTKNRDKELADMEIAIKGRDKKPGAALYFLDSHSNSPREDIDGYAWFYDSQVRWMRRKNAAMTDSNGGVPVPALAFFHICLPEYIDAWKNRRNPHIGRAAEGECPGAINTGMFAAMVEGRSVMGTFVGHDHDIDYIVVDKGIALGYGRYSGDNTTYNNLRPGARIIDLTEGSRSYVTWILEDDGRVVDKVEFSDNKITKRK